MIGKSIQAYIGIRISIGFFRAIAPASFAYIFACIILRTFVFSPWILLIAAPEALFYLFGYLPRRSRLIRVLLLCTYSENALLMVIASFTRSRTPYKGRARAHVLELHPKPSESPPMVSF